MNFSRFAATLLIPLATTGLWESRCCINDSREPGWVITCRESWSCYCSIERERESCSYRKLIAMNAADYATPCCAGTRRDLKIDGIAKLGMMAVFTESKHVSSPHGHIRILVTDGSDSYEGDVQVDDTRGLEDDATVAEKVQLLSSYLLDDHNPNITISLKMDSSSLRLGMSKRTGTGINRQVFSTLLSLTGNGSMIVCQQLASALEHEKHCVQQVEKELKKAQEEAAIWKDSHTKVQKAMQNREDELLSQFLELYRATHKKLKDTEQQLQQLQTSSSLVAVAAPKAATAPAKRAARSTKAKVTLDDNDDAEPYPNDVVQSLASTGKGRPKRGAKKAEASDEASIVEEPDRKRRRNQVSAAKRNTGKNRDDDLSSEKDTKPPARNGRASKASKKFDESDDDEDEDEKDKSGKMVDDEDSEVKDHPVAMSVAAQPQTSGTSTSLTDTDTAENRGASESASATAVDNGDAEDLDEELDAMKEWIKSLRENAEGT